MSNTVEQDLQDIQRELDQQEGEYIAPKGEKVHECDKYLKAISGVIPGYFDGGEAILGTMNFHDATKRWWMSNGVQSSPVFFCPYCGLDLKKLYWAG